MTGYPKSYKGRNWSLDSLFFYHHINHPSFLELPSFPKKVMLKSVRKAFWEDWLGSLGLFQWIPDELACFDEALSIVHKTGLRQLSNFGPGLSMCLSQQSSVTWCTSCWKCCFWGSTSIKCYSCVSTEPKPAKRE